MKNFENLKYVDDISLANRTARAMWGLVYRLLFRPSPRRGGNAWRLFLLRRFGASIGKGSKVSPSCKIWAPWNLQMGEFSVIGDDVDCYSMDKITLGSKVAVSQRAYLCTGSHDISSLLRPLVTRPIVIGDHAWICAESFIGPGVVIGEGAVVGARACVTRNVDAWTVVAGNPATRIKIRQLKSQQNA